MFPEKKTTNNTLIQYLPGLLLIFLIITSVSLKGDYLSHSEQNIKSEDDERVSNDSNQECDLFSGRWVYDDKPSPQYRDETCSFMFDAYACEKYGRKDLKHQNWRWQPHHCDLPSFNGTAFLEKIRGKKLIFVGDSLNKNQWTSMLCLIESSTPSLSSPRNLTTIGNLIFYQATEYNATIGFYWSPFLVESNNDDLVIHHTQDRIVRIDAIENHARHWSDADMLIFDSYAWWNGPKLTVLWGSFNSSEAIYKTLLNMNPRAYEMALNTWSEWLEFHINRTKTKLFFMSLSPMHEWGEDWSTEQNCYNQTEPILKDINWALSTDREIMHIAESTMKNLDKRGIKVQYLNVTQLSSYRKDGHPSIYKKFYQTLSEEQLKNPKSYSDCLHWCLPGLPDIWNQILYSYIVNS